MRKALTRALVASATLVASSPVPSESNGPVLFQDHSLHCEQSGLSSLKYMFIFGDSYTTTGFDVTGTQPSAGNPFGNPAYPGYTSSNGPNWIDFLATTYNQSAVEVVNLAYGGATVDSSLVAPYESTVLSVKQQVQQEYLPNYAKSSSAFPWQPANTLFGIWVGINDVGNSYYKQNATINDLIFNVYSGLVDELYRSGARNFLFLNVPPTDKAPLLTASGEWAETTIAADIADFNNRITAMANNLTRTYADAKTLVFDANSLFNQILANPSSFPQTAPIKNTTAYCEAYENGTIATNTYDASCGLPVDEYFWLNSLHPIYRVQNVTAQHVAAQLATSSLAC